MKTLTRVSAFLLPTLLFPLLASAATSCGGSGGLVNPLGTCEIAVFFANLLRLVAIIAFPIIVLFIVYIGFLFVTSGSKPEKIKEARNYFFWALVGALLILGAEALSYAIKATVDQL